MNVALTRLQHKQRRRAPTLTEWKQQRRLVRIERGSGLEFALALLVSAIVLAVILGFALR